MAVAAAREGAGGEARKARRVVGSREESERRRRTRDDHLAGRIAAAIADRLVERGAIEFSADGGAVTAEGATILSDLGVDLDAAGRAARRGRIFLVSAAPRSGASAGPTSLAPLARRSVKPVSPRAGRVRSAAGARWR